MASMYLLENPDHYTSHQFIPFWWKLYVNEITRTETFCGEVNLKHGIDVNMEDCYQARMEVSSDFSNDDEINNHDVDVKMEDIYQDIEKKESMYLSKDDMDVEGPRNIVEGRPSGVERSVLVDYKTEDNKKI